MAKKRFELSTPEIIAEPVPPDAAIEFWKQRAKLTDEEAKALGEGAKQRAFYVTGLARRDLVQLVSDGIEEALKDGETLADFKKRIVAAIQAQGWHDYRVENIFRTNMQTAYSAGRYKKMQAVKASRPYWQYIAVMDRRVRPSHAILHKKVYPAEHEFWASNSPPNGLRCRCGVRTRSERQVKAQGLIVEMEMPKAGVWTDPRTGMEYFVHFPGADKGFKSNPGKDWLDGLDLKKYPDLGKKSYEGQRGPATKRPEPVKTYAELAEGIKQRCSEFATNAGINSVITESGKGYFMATNSRGTLFLNSKSFVSCNGFNPLRELKSAWNKLAQGKELTFHEEYSLESLWHELTHNRQKTGDVGGKKSPTRRIMEIFTQWTARRTYPRLLESLGGKAVHQAEILKKGYGYGYWIKNFDRLLDVLNIKDEDLLPEMLRLMSTVSRADYDGEIKELLAGMSGREFMNVAIAVDGLDEYDFEKQLIIAALI